MIAFRILSSHVREFGFRNLANFCLCRQEFEKFFSVESEIQERDPFNQNSDRSDREKWSASKGGRFLETFPVGPNRSIEFWTEVSRNFGRMDRAPGLWNPEYSLRNPESRSSTDKESGIQEWESGLSPWSRTVYGQNNFIYLDPGISEKNWRN